MTATRTRTKPKPERPALEPIAFELSGREWDTYERNRFVVAKGLHDAAADGLVEPIEALERAIGVANRTTEERTAAWEERQAIVNPIALEEVEARSAFEALAGDEPSGLGDRARKVAEAARRVEELDVALRIADGMLTHAIRRVLGEVQEPVLGALNAGLARLFATAVEAVAGFPADADERAIMRGSAAGVDAFVAFDRAAAGYARLREIYGRWVIIGGYEPDMLATRGGRVLSECRNPREVERSVAGDDRQVPNPLGAPSRVWPDESGFEPAERDAALRRRFELLARHGGEPWMPSPTELAQACARGGVRPPQPAPMPAWVRG